MSSSTSSSRRRFHVPRRHPVVVDIGCSCRKPKLFSGLMHNYLPLSMKSSNNNNKKKSRESSTTTSSSLTTTITNSTFSPCNDDGDFTTRSSSSSACYASPKNYKKKKEEKKKKKKAMAVAEESVAVEKVSSDPYLDFKESMLQMIVEKEIYQWEELRELLNLFLSLNSPYHHHLILQAFAEIWEA